MKNLHVAKKSFFFPIIALSFLLFCTNAFASFPVKKVKAVEVVTVQNSDVYQTNLNLDESEVINPITAVAGYDKWVAAALWFLLGWPFAAHRWYAKKPVGWNILFILTIGGLGIWAIVDIINILTDNF